MTAQSQLADLRYLLVKSLAGIPCLDRAHCCALLNHPSHGNLGDHLIWAAQLHYLEQVRQLPVRYVASPDLWEPRKIKNLTSTDAYKKTPRGAKGSNKLYIKMTELTQAASY